MAKLEVTLKQHTPLIHFESDIEGATLRATELKPKLDKFLVEHFRKESIDYSNYLIKGQKKSFNYKIKLYFENSNKIRMATFINKKEKEKLEKEKIEFEQGIPYFGDNYAFIYKNIRAEFFSFNEKILEIIRIVLPSFFIFNNFGSRQSKGFGSFTATQYRINLGKEYIDYKYDVKDIINQEKNLYFFKESSNPLNYINKFYTLLKSGINFNDYKKSKIVEFIGQEYRWEKAIIKQTLKIKYPIYYKKLQGNNERSLHKDIVNYRYVRGLLGLAEHIEFSFNNFQKLLIKIYNKDISRFKSPLTFKVIDNVIYLIPNEIPEELFNCSFNFILEYKVKEKDKWILKESDNNFLTCNTPSEEEFNLIEFLKFATMEQFEVINNG